MPNAEYIQALLEGRDPPGCPPTDPPWADLSTRLQEIPVSDRHAELAQWVSTTDRDGGEVMSALTALQCGGRVTHISGHIWTVSSLLEQDFGEPPVIVGEPTNALVVRGEIHFIVGPPGIGKTLLCFDMGLRVVSGRGVFGYLIGTDSPLRVLIFQAELPLYFVRYRLARMVRWTDLQDAGEVPDAFNRIFIPELTGSIFIDDADGLAEIMRLAREWTPDIIIFDPFLSFFGGDSENDNTAVRRALDVLKREVAQQFECAIIITDHLSKVVGSGEEPRARGAGAKVDVASLVINLSRANAPEGDDEAQFIKLQITKMRHGWPPAEPIILRRDPGSLRHQIWDPGLDEVFDVVRRIITEAGGEISTKGELLRLLAENSAIGRRRAAQVLARAVRAGLVVESTGPRNSKIYRLSEAGVACRQLDESDEGESDNSV